MEEESISRPLSDSSKKVSIHETLPPINMTEQINNAVEIAVSQALADKDQMSGIDETPTDPFMTHGDNFMPSNEMNEKGELISLMSGDLIWLRSDGNVFLYLIGCDKFHL